MKPTNYHLQIVLTVTHIQDREQQGHREVSNKLEHKTHSGDKGCPMRKSFTHQAAQIATRFCPNN